MPELTTGTATRPAHRVRAPMLTFSLATEAFQLRKEAAATLHQDRNAKTLVKEADFSIVLLLMNKGCVLRQHVVAAEIAIQSLSGHVRLSTPEQQADLVAGQLVVLDRGIPFSLEALTESNFILTVARHALPELTGFDLDADDLGPEGRE